MNTPIPHSVTLINFQQPCLWLQSHKNEKILSLILTKKITVRSIPYQDTQFLTGGET